MPHSTDPLPAPTDYDRIARAIAFIAESVTHQPTLEDIAAHVHLSPFHFQRVFTRWAGVSPKKFLQFLTVEHAKALLEASRPLLEVSGALGLSSASRLHDHFVQLEAVTPGEYKRAGDGLTIEYGVHATPFGRAFVASTPRGICRVDFIDDRAPDAPLEALARLWPRAGFRACPAATRPLVDTMVGRTEHARSVRVFVGGSPFQIQVWKALIALPSASLASYADLASLIGRPRSARAVGLAMGANPVAYLIPCHRVIRQSGAVGGYRWGETRKRAIHAWEAARTEVER